MSELSDLICRNSFLTEQFETESTDISTIRLFYLGLAQCKATVEYPDATLDFLVHPNTFAVVGVAPRLRCIKEETILSRLSGWKK